MNWFFRFTTFLLWITRPLTSGPHCLDRTHTELVGRKTGSKKHVIYFNLTLNDNVLFSNILCFFSDLLLFFFNVPIFMSVSSPYIEFQEPPFHIYVSHTVLLPIFFLLIDLHLLSPHLLDPCLCGSSPLIPAPCRNVHFAL